MAGWNRSRRWARWVASLVLAVALVPALAASGPALARFGARDDAPPPRAARICFCQDAFRDAQEPGLRRLDGCWVMAGARGIQAFSRAGEAVPVPGLPRLDPEQPCVAVVALPAGEGQVPVSAPRLACAVSAPGADRIFALELDGSWRELPLGGTGAADAPRTVRDLALDRDGNVFVALGDRRDILRIDLAGNVILHARLPEGVARSDGKADCAGVLAMVRDPRSGHLYVAEPSCLWKVTSRGLVIPVPVDVPANPRHLAVHGRKLLIADPHRRELWTLHLKRKRLATLLGQAGDEDGAGTRFGPIQRYAPALPAASCAALGGAGPVAAAADGCCLLEVEQGFATFTLPEAPASGASRPAAAARAQKQGPTRQEKLERWRAGQLELRNHKKHLRELGNREARKRAEQEQAARTRPHPGAGNSRGHARASSGTRPGGMFCLVLLGLGALTDPGLMQAMAQAVPPFPPPFPPLGLPPIPGADMTAFVHANSANALAGLDQLDQVCAAPCLADRDVAPCAGGYMDQVRAQVDEVQAEGVRLLVEPAALGVGPCGVGETEEEAAERGGLVQSWVLSDYERLSAAATGLWYQLLRDGYVLLAVGAELLAGQAAASPVGANASSLASIPSFVLGEVGASLITAGFGVHTAGAGFARLGFQATAQQARYQRWSNNQIDQPRNCTAIALPDLPMPASAGSAGVFTGTAPTSPLPILQDAMQRLQSGCALVAAQHGLDLQVCTPESLAAFQQRNTTLARVYSEGIACLTSGALRGILAPCPRMAPAMARASSDTLAYFIEFQAEVGEAAAMVFGAGNGFYIGSEASVVAGNAASQAEAVLPGKAALIVADTFSSVGNVLIGSGYDLFRIGTLARGWAASVTKGFNAASWADLNQREFWKRVANSSANATSP
jgi:hypothetical protein